MDHTCLCLPSRSWYSLPSPEGWKAELALLVYCMVLVYLQFHCYFVPTHAGLARLG